MNRIFMSILISFSILLASDISVKTEREILKETLTTNHIINESNIPSSIQLPKAERKQESSLVKKQLAEYKKSIDTKMNIVKKLVSANNKKGNDSRSKENYTANTVLDPTSVNLKMKKQSSHFNKTLASSQSRRVVNKDVNVKSAIYPELSKKASDSSILKEIRTKIKNKRRNGTISLPANIIDNYTEEHIDAISTGNTISNMLTERNRDDMWLNNQQLEVNYSTGENQALTNRYFNNDNNLIEEVHWNFDSYYQEWFLSHRFTFYYGENGNISYYTYEFDLLDENGSISHLYHYIHNYNEDGTLSYMDILYMGYDYPEHIYRYTYEYSDNSNLLAQRNDYYAWYGELSETPFRRTIYNYDENSNLILESTQDYMMYMGSGGQWQNNQRYVMSYDGALLSSRVLQFFNFMGGNGWSNINRSDFEYDDNSNLSLEILSTASANAPDGFSPISLRYYFWESTDTQEDINGQEFYYESVVDLYANFGAVLNSYGVDCHDCASMNDVGEPLQVIALDEQSFTNFVSIFGFQSLYFQFMDTNGNGQYDVEETYVVSCENSDLGFSDHSVSYSGGVYNMNFNRFWWLAYDFIFYEYDVSGSDILIWDGYDFPFGWQMFSWGDAQLDTTIADGYTDDYYDTPNSALSYVQGGQWSGAGLDFAPPLDLTFHADHSSLNFWMWGEQNAPMLRIQFEDGQDRVGYNFTPESTEGWYYYELPLSDFIFFDGSQTFDWQQVRILQVMGEGNGVAGRTFHFSNMAISGTENNDEDVYFDFVGNLNGHSYFLSQEPMTWHEGLNFTDTVNADGFVHMVTINSEEENLFIENSLQSQGLSSERVWIGLTDEFEEGNWQWVTGEPIEYTSWAEGEPNNSGGMEHYANFNINSGDWSDAPYDESNLVLVEFIPNNPPDGPSILGSWEMGPFAGSMRVGPEPFSGDWWSISADDVQTRACYFDDLYVFDEEGFHNDHGEETWLEWWQGMDPEGCGTPVFPHDGSGNPAGYVFNEEAGTLTLNGVGSYLGLPKAVNGAELTSPDQAPGSITYQIYMNEEPEMMTLVIEVGEGIFWTFDLVPAMNDEESIYFVKEDYADVTNSDNWDHITASVAIMRGDNQGLYNPYIEDSYNGLGPSGTLWHLGPTREANPMNYTDWVNAIGGQAANLPGQTLSLWCLEEDQYFDINFESWTSGNNGGGFSYWRTGVEPPEGPNVHIVWGLMGSDETGDGSFENPFATIGHAVNIMENDDMIAVGPGGYNENIVVTDKSGLLVSFSGSDSTFINGNGGQILNSHNGFWMIDGFTFTNGSAVEGGAVLCVNGGLMVGRSIFAGNNAEANGGAIAAINSIVFMDSVTVLENIAGGDGGALFINNFMENLDQPWFTGISNSRFIQNIAGDKGGGLYVVSLDYANSYVDLYNINARNNSANAFGGIRLKGNIQVNVDQSYFIGNLAQAYAAAGGIDEGAYGEFNYCTVANNEANLNNGTNNSGGFSVWRGSYGNFYHCTFVGNSSQYGTALTVGGGSYASLDASIVWNNPGDNALASVQWDENGSQLDVFHSVVQGGENGMYSDDLSNIYQDGVIDIDPLFCDPENGDFSIDMNSGAITPWGDPMGALGFGCEGNVMASANILSVVDVPDDQGGRVYITFEKSLFDTDGLGRTEMYTVERMDGEQWVGLTSIGAYASEMYVVEATTLSDSTSESNAMTTYRVVANMDEGNFESDPASGYSVDNIAPMMVTGLNAEVADGMVMLSWGHSDANDFSHYMIYYSAVAGFIPSEETMIGIHSLPSFEHNVEEIGDHYYIVSAVDMNENESEYSEAVNVTLLTLVDVHGLPETFALHQNYPNPFNPNTTIRFDLPKASNVSLAIYDMMGREVTSLINSQIDAGYHFIQWDGSNNHGSFVAAGVYIYTIQAGKYRAINKMIYLK